MIFNDKGHMHEILDIKQYLSRMFSNKFHSKSMKKRKNGKVFPLFI